MTLPDAIPEPIRKSYREAVLVAPISGSASAALSRRCLQGIVRDFFDIPENRKGELGAELSYVKDKIDHSTWTDIQNVRSIGDIGAHMDKNTNVIIDVDEEEADRLVALIEYLFRSWYIERERRKASSAALAAAVTSKRELQKAAKIDAKALRAVEETTPDGDNKTI
ncbi:DUF4145 domain-containing protein [Rhizobium sp. TRM96647]|uniref:DUF4145 domain-containing protein n=1 Tax=unclassified Rhizobium TaxID=2613769 RepID=UPI0021E727A3|nr:MULTISPECIES: DUF4145 domain-containing protein [unclassified Rhizobium]MCV3738220.1 DUF4145 domain-containing protein [Rhizobium sp. TRM96647]MCV3760031.1 DUF4145 domain-containing protein [Rhizobium sp. TRM96650]